MLVVVRMNGSHLDEIASCRRPQCRARACEHILAAPASRIGPQAEFRVRRTVVGWDGQRKADSGQRTAVNNAVGRLSG